MYWLRLTDSHEERLKLLNQYIGRPRVPQHHEWVQDTAALNGHWHSLEQRMYSVNQVRANAFRHYCGAMHRAFGELAKLLNCGSPAVFVVGHSTWNETPINTSDLFQELSGEWFELSETWSYKVRNRYMSYARKNGANIDREHVLVLKRM